MSWNEKVQNWRNQESTSRGESLHNSGDEHLPERNFTTDDDSYKDGDEDEYRDENEEHDADEMGLGQAAAELSTLRDCLVNSSAYQWLNNALTREILLAPAVPNVRDRIRHEVLCSLPPTRVSRLHDAQSYNAIFEMDWDPRTFIKRQNYDEESDDPIGMAITLTASSQDSQALTARQYLSQIWPTIGDHVMRMIQEILSGKWKEDRYGETSHT